VSLHVRGEPRQVVANKWETIRYALDSTARTVRLCIIVLVASVPPGILAFLIHR
jgi:hypothetical protein